MAVSFCAQAQFVTIPDVNFRNYLIALCPSCFNGSQQMDTTCSGILNVTTLDVSNKYITDLEGIRYFNNLLDLNCSNNLLNSLPNLPYLINRLDCSSNKLTSLTTLHTNLKFLFCTNNQLTSLPTLPDNLILLLCNSNQLTNLPSLPNKLKYLHFSNNPLLSCIPILPDSLINDIPTLFFNFKDLDITNTSIKCIPNLPPLIEDIVPTFPITPICSSGSSCEPNPTSSGLVFHDLNSNGVYNVGIDSTLKGWIVSNTNGWATASMQNGEYITKLDSGVVNTLTLSGPTLYIQSINPTSIQIIPTSSGSQGSNYNFAVQFIPNIQDLRVDIAAGPARPGFNQWCTTTVNNVGTLNVNNATLKVLKPTTFTLLNANPPISQQVGDTLIWNNINLGVLQHKGFDINWNIPANSVLGAPYQIQAWINPISTDTTPVNNHIVFNGIFQGSYDPNDKSVNNGILEPADLNNNLKYTIRFQNTGTDTAFTVMIRDTLSDNLDRSTFRILGASHNYSFIVRDHSLLEVFFQNILLPDSFTNEPKSHGFVQYSVKPKATLAVGEEINNTAYIYFDFNVPIVTNTTNTRIVKTSIGEAFSINADIYPNPNNGKVLLRLLSVTESATLSIQDLNGRELLSLEVKNGQEVDLSGLSVGMYLAKIETKLGSKRMKLVKE